LALREKKVANLWFGLRDAGVAEAPCLYLAKKHSSCKDSSGCLVNDDDGGYLGALGDLCFSSCFVKKKERKKAKRDSPKAGHELKEESSQGLSGLLPKFWCRVTCKGGRALAAERRRGYALELGTGGKTRRH
jgi:hypothetical protein